MNYYDYCFFLRNKWKPLQRWRLVERGERDPMSKINHPSESAYIMRRNFLIVTACLDKVVPEPAGSCEIYTPSCHSIHRLYFRVNEFLTNFITKQNTTALSGRGIFHIHCLLEN